MKQPFLGAAIAAMIAISGVANAQYSGSTSVNARPSGVTFRGGIILPVDSNLRDVSTTFIGIGMEYSLTHTYLNSGETFVSVDWFGKSGSGAHGNVFPVCINQRFYTGTKTNRYGSGRTYFFVGAGVTFIDVTEATNQIGARGGIGMELGPSIVVEAAGYLSGKARDGVSADAVGLYVGYRFP